ncbi:hypothetical protein [Brevibacillus sedimenti]|jgi:hypothetical protein|uniref:hypothetical protein n=1 Tax=Brevibacillus sedimenti TaxID=2613334 RepID=UPI001E40FCE1|nr:hypothetical protein [Anoxybacillus sediminis]UFJ62242.1 hypothetical protein IRT44_05375 [Anoxybacillus sediminis]
MTVCPGQKGYPKKPNYSDFYDRYASYAEEAANQIGIPTEVVLCQWFQEWGIPINNPAFQTSTMGRTTEKNKSCGSFPIFASLTEGTIAYYEQIKKRYNGGKDAYDNIFGEKTNLRGAYENGFKGGLKASNVKTDDGKTLKSVTSQNFSPGAYAVNEMLGSSKWNAGHYMLSTDSYPGRRLNIILNNSGWL